MDGTHGSVTQGLEDSRTQGVRESGSEGVGANIEQGNMKTIRAQPWFAGLGSAATAGGLQCDSGCKIVETETETETESEHAPEPLHATS